ncbi:MAG TPA: hypothetical protein VMG55_04155 [Stellaceae bacterium]|nr:hypothetical protein [Stellaceae bacterium]
MFSGADLVASVARIGIAGLRARASSHVTGATISMAFGIALSCIAAAFGIAALSDYLVDVLGATRGHLAVACVLLCLGLIAFLVGNRLRASRQRAAAQRAPRAHADLALLLNGAEDLVRQNKGASILAAFLTGLYVDRERHSADDH